MLATCTCGEERSVGAQHAGKQFKCRSCGAVVQIPTAASPETDPEEAAVDDDTASEAGLPPRVGRKSKAAAASGEKSGRKSRKAGAARSSSSAIWDVCRGLFAFLWPYLLGAGVVLGLIIAGARWNAARQQEAEVVKRLGPLDADISGPWLSQDPQVRGRLMIVERDFSSAHLATGGFSPLQVSGIQSQLPQELRATLSDPVVTYVLITKSMDFKGETYVKQEPAPAPGQPAPKPQKVVGGVEKRAEALVLYWEAGKFKVVGTKRFTTETPQEVKHRVQTTMAPALDPLIRDWLLGLPRG